MENYTKLMDKNSFLHFTYIHLNIIFNMNTISQNNVERSFQYNMKELLLWQRCFSRRIIQARYKNFFLFDRSSREILMDTINKCPLDYTVYQSSPTFTALHIWGEGKGEGIAPHKRPASMYLHAASFVQVACMHTCCSRKWSTRAYALCSRRGCEHMCWPFPQPSCNLLTAH